MKDKYNHQEIEKKWQKYWKTAIKENGKESSIYAFRDDQPREQTFVIDTPPPTVSGFLHMGHVFSYTQADFVARYKRMRGFDVFYPMGFDDNGLPTERLVEKIIDKKAGLYEKENGAGSFVKKCEEIVEEAEKEFEILFNSIALSVDWSQKYQTISAESQKISQASFVDLYKKGFATKKFEPVFWDISDRTALAQADLVDKEVDGVMNYILFGVEGSEKPLEIMTTRPELLPACVAVMINPEDERFKNLHGKFAITPIFGAKVPIIADEDVQMDKGTGAVMCCTFGDETDIKWWRKHKLQLKLILGEDGKMLEKKDASSLEVEESSYKKLCENKKAKEAKDAIIEELKLQNLLTKQEPIKRAVKCAERSGVPIEILVVPQWFINILDHKEALKQKARECNWHPDYMRIRIEQWIDGLQWDWCISRQRFFGVKFPVWYSKRKGEEGKILVADFDQLPCDPTTALPKGYSREEVTPETDILDTWATSSVSPQLSSHGISDEIAFDKARHAKLFPADMRPQAHEIIRTWAFYTIVKAYLHQNSIPWKNLMISGWCLAADKTKMSKSKGNIVTPTALVEEKGSDVVRYFASNSHLGADTAYSEEVFKIGQKLITKLFNSAKFVSLMIGENFKPSHEITQTADLWILSKLHETAKHATQEFEKFEYARAREKIEEFFWKDFCDNYLEIVKVRAYGEKAEKWQNKTISQDELTNIKNGQKSAQNTLFICLNTILKLFAPFLPHLTEELYSGLFAEEFAQKKSINARNNWPEISQIRHDENAKKIGEEALRVIFEVRKFKSDNNLSMKTTIARLKIAHPQDLTPILADLTNVCNAAQVEFVIGEMAVEIF